MATKTKHKRGEQVVDQPARPFWGARTRFEVGNTRRQRQAQYKQQINTLVGVLGVTLVLGCVFILFNWNNGGSTKPLSCESYPKYCVPLAGGSSEFASLEAPESRALDTPNSTAAPTVERYIDANYIATLGNPNAPLHFVVVSDFACPHCQDYHKSDMPNIIDDLVLTGKATFGIVMVTGTGGAYSEIASQAALCAGEQGAFWEFSDELFRLAESRGIDQAFSIKQLGSSAKDMGLDSKALTSCLSSTRYSAYLRQYSNFAGDNGVSGTPTILVSYGNTNQWSTVNREFDSLKRLTDTANAQ
jgi:protein-disulfide isomerase